MFVFSLSHLTDFNDDNKMLIAITVKRVKVFFSIDISTERKVSNIPIVATPLMR